MTDANPKDGFERIGSIRTLVIVDDRICRMGVSATRIRSQTRDGARRVAIAGAG
jgi:hypothetical protein